MSGGDLLSCYHPIAAFPDYDAGLTDNGKFHYKLSGAYHPEMYKLDPNVIKIPCGKCLGCQLDFARSWADRMILELDSYDGQGIFVTLTYDNDHITYVQDGDLEDVPVGFTLNKRDIQLFLKRLRKDFPGRKLRYFVCGEYGSNTHRPHVHGIIFGLGVDDFEDRKIKGKNELGQIYFISDRLYSIWQNGFILFSEVSYKTCSYVARYVTKKAFDEEVPYGAEPEFRLMSRRPGLGRKYLEDHPDCLDLNKICLSDQNGHVEVLIPKYFLSQLKLTDPEAHANFIRERAHIARDKELLKLQHTSLSYLEQLELEENTLINKTKILFNRRKEVL